MASETVSAPLAIPVEDVPAAILILEEIEGGRNWRRHRVGTLQTIRGSLEPTSIEGQLNSEADTLDRFATSLRRALYGDPSLGDGDHFAGQVGIHRLRVVQRPPSGDPEPTPTHDPAVHAKYPASNELFVGCAGCEQEYQQGVVGGLGG
jgi:hypothetical protein